LKKSKRTNAASSRFLEKGFDFQAFYCKRGTFLLPFFCC
jgi:hypothetical protein